MADVFLLDDELASEFVTFAPRRVILSCKGFGLPVIVAQCKLREFHLHFSTKQINDIESNFAPGSRQLIRLVLCNKVPDTAGKLSKLYGMCIRHLITCCCLKEGDTTTQLFGGSIWVNYQYVTFIFVLIPFFASPAVHERVVFS